MVLITNRGGNTMEKALSDALPDADSVDICTAYFYFSGFDRIAPLLKDKRVRILVGKTVDPEVTDELANALKVNPDTDLGPFGSKKQNLMRNERRYHFTESFIRLFNRSALSEAFHSSAGLESFKIFEEKLRDGSLELRMTSKDNHSKFYILTNKPERNQGGSYLGTVFMGSSNFTFSGLLGQGELVQPYRDNDNYNSYKSYFDEMWEDSIDIKSKDGNNSFMNEIQHRLWIHSTPDPYLIYARILYELYGTIEEKEDVTTPQGITGGKFSNLKYQLDAIKQGIDCIEKYNGVIIADVVGLGKSIIASAIAHNLDINRTVIIVPPHLKQQWEGYVQDFGIRGAIVESCGKIASLHQRLANDDRDTLYIIDEAHRYRNELTDDYQNLHQLTRSSANNKVILLTATPYNNKPNDLFALIKLFQTPSRSTINSVENLGIKFRELIGQYIKLERQGKKNCNEDITKKLEDLSAEIRSLIDPVIIRRSRLDLRRIHEYADDLKAQGIDFPEVVGPELIEYDLGVIKSQYIKTLQEITDTEDGFRGARYQSANYINNREEFVNKYGKFFDESDLKTAQKNLAQFMRRLLVTRFESSKYAFKSTLLNIIKSHEVITRWWNEKGVVPIQKQGQILSPDEVGDDFGSIEEMLQQITENEDFERKNNEALYIPRELFKDDFIYDVQNDLRLLRRIYDEWFSDESFAEIDPKLEEVKCEINSHLEDNMDRKIVIFSSYADTAEWVAKKLKDANYRVLLYTGSSRAQDKTVVSQNFDASWPEDDQKNDYDIIVATDALSEGFNLHRAGVIINYDIPYNPTRVVQRIGRINRINKKVYDKIYIQNFFPTDLGNDITNIKNISTLKMLLINNIVGSDTRTLTPDEDLESFFRSSYEEADAEAGELSWDVEYRNDYNALRNSPIMEKARDIPEHTRIVRNNRPEKVSIGFAKRGESSLFAMTGEDGLTADIWPAERVLPLFKAEPEERSTEGDDELSKRFSVLYEKITEKHRVPEIEGRRQDALKNLEFLIDNYPQEKDYLIDLRDIILEFDDLSDGELKYIAQLHFKDGIPEAVKELHEKFSDHYISVIKEKANAVDAVAEIMVFAEDLRQ